MHGQIGIFYDLIGNEIGGCLGWSISFEIINCRETHKPCNWRARTESFWFKEIHQKFIACFFWVIKGNILLACKEKIKTELADIELNKMHRTYLELQKYES